MFVVADKSAAVQSGLAALVLLLRFHGVSAYIEQIRHRFGDDIGAPEILRCAREFGLQAWTYRSNWQQLIKAPLPGIAFMRDGRCLLPVKAIENRILVQDPLSPRPTIISRAEFEAIWDGCLILMGPRAGLLDFSHRCVDGRLGVIHKNREVLGRVLAASFSALLLFFGPRKKVGKRHVESDLENRNHDEANDQLSVASDRPAEARSKLAASRHLGITWCLGAIPKFCYLLGQALVPSFFLRLPILVSPVFFGLRKRVGIRDAENDLKSRGGDRPDDEPLAATDRPAAARSRLEALVLLLRFHGISADPEQIRHRFGDCFGVAEVLRCAKEIGLKARMYRSNWQRLIETPLPGIAVLRDGNCLILGKASEDKVLVQDPLSPQPTLMSRAEFEAIWDGYIILIARRAGLVDLSRRIRHQLVPRCHPQVSPSAR